MKSSRNESLKWTNEGTANNISPNEHEGMSRFENHQYTRRLITLSNNSVLQNRNNKIL